MNDADLQAFTHILYLHNAPQEIAGRREGDESRKRAAMGVDKLMKWRDAEMIRLQKLCRALSILFMKVHDHSIAIQRVKDFVRHNSEYNEELVAQELETSIMAQSVDQSGQATLESVMKDLELIANGEVGIKTMLVIDADNTLAPEDASELFWKQLPDIDNPLNELSIAR